MFFRLSTSLRLSAPFRFAAPVAHMLLRAPLHRSPGALLPPRSPSSHAASHGPVARSSQRSLATTATGHSAAASSRRRTAACALLSARAPAAPCPLYYCSLVPLPAPDAAPSLALLALSPRRVARTLSVAGTGGEGVVRGNGGARGGSAAMLASGAWGESHKGQRGFGGGALPRATTAEGAVLRGGEAGGTSGMGAVRGTGAPGATGASGRADGPARQGVVAQARWGGVEGAAAGGRAVVLWDLDNVQPERMEPFDAATRLTDLAASFGSPVDVLAYANRHAFEHVPAWVREQRRERRDAERMAARGEAEEREVRCELCGRRCSGAVALRKHFVSLHQREHEKRMQHLNHASPKRKRRLREEYRGKQQRYQQAVRGVLLPRRGYGLMPELRRAGVVVRLVSQQSQEGGEGGGEAADEALKRDLAAAVRSGQVGAVLLVSDDRGYSRALGAAAAAGLTTVAVGINGRRCTGGSGGAMCSRAAPWRSPGERRREWRAGGEGTGGTRRRGGAGWKGMRGAMRGGGAVVRERAERGNAVGSGARGALLGLEDVGRRGVAMEGQADRWTHGDVHGGQGEGRYGMTGVGGGVEDEGGEWDDGEEWMEEEWDEDEWESQGEEEDDRDDGDKVRRCELEEECVYSGDFISIRCAHLRAAALYYVTLAFTQCPLLLPTFHLLHCTASSSVHSEHPRVLRVLPGSQGFSHQVFGGAGDVARPHANP
ncbi:unnamed protein product [Closterium sp. Naga37s-1]|nr:unnamed protein product [Closterium sp. Naga37s-1]